MTLHSDTNSTVSFQLRAAQPTDAGQMGDILYHFEEVTSWMPKEHSAAEAISFCDRMIARGWVTVAVQDRCVLGFIARDGHEICALYVAHAARGQGVGHALLSLAQIEVSRLTLRCAQANHAASAFYLCHGFQEIGRSDGSQTPENLPDIAYIWTNEGARSTSAGAGMETQT